MTAKGRNSTKKWGAELRVAGRRQITWWNFYFRLFAGTICSPQVVEFLQHLLRHFPGRLLIVWDGLPNRSPKNLWELGYFARRALRRMRRRPTLVQAFWKQAGLFDDATTLCNLQ